MKNTLDYILGIHSNIPECCVLFYCKNQRRICSINARRINKWPAFLSEWGRSVQYVFCTKCYKGFRAGKIVPNVIHKCKAGSNDPICRFYDNVWDVDFQVRLNTLRKELGVNIKC